MWRKIVSPEMLFAVGGLQSLSPYIWWTLIDKNPDYEYQVSFIPMIFWLGGYLAFLIGCRPIIPRHNAFTARNSVLTDASRWRWQGLLCFLIAVVERSGEEGGSSEK